MKTIYFKSGLKKKITDEEFEIIMKLLYNGNAANFQSFSKEGEKPYLVINLSQISYIN